MKRYILLGLLVLAMAVETRFIASPINDIPPQNVEIEGKVSSTDVQVGQPFKLDLSLKVPYGWFVEWNDFDADTLSDQIDIIDRGVVERTFDADSNIVVKQQLTLMTFDTGTVQLPRVGLKYARSQEDSLRMEAFTNPIDLYSTSIVVDTLQPFKPIQEPISAPIQMKEVYPWLLGVLVLVLVTFGVLYLIKRRKRKVDADGNVIRGPVIPPYDKAISDLENLRQQKLWQSGKVKEYFSTLTDIAREYIEGQFGVNALEMTTDDILEEIKPMHFPKETYDKLKDTMEVADLVKFAKYSASNLEYDKAMNSMSEFVNESYAHFQKTLSPSASPQTDGTMSPSASSQMDKSDCGTQSATMKEEVKDV